MEKEVSQTILTSSSMATVIETPKPICLNNRFKQPSVQDRIYDSEAKLQQQLQLVNSDLKLQKEKNV